MTPFEGGSAPEITDGNVLARAASGDPKALRHLATQSVALASAFESPAGRVAAVAEAVTFTRLACVNGGLEEDRCLAVLYDSLADLCEDAEDQEAADAFRAQALLTAEGLADQGDEEMATLVVTAGGNLSADVHKRAAQIRELM
ncbi:MAG: hypothetical protein HRT64_13520 [Erythrobacter sp.]|nr:hypothetical protein [Erythrobacter sp.]